MEHFGDLTDELLLAVERLALGKGRLEVMESVVRDIEQLVMGPALKVTPQLKATWVGSAAWGLATRQSALDFAISGTGAGGSFEGGRDEELNVLTSLAARCGERGVFDKAEVIPMRSKAPSILKCGHRRSGIQCDLVIRHGTGGRYTRHRPRRPVVIVWSKGWGEGSTAHPKPSQYTPTPIQALMLVSPRASSYVDTLRYTSTRKRGHYVC